MLLLRNLSLFSKTVAANEAMFCTETCWSARSAGIATAKLARLDARQHKRVENIFEKVYRSYDGVRDAKSPYMLLDQVFALEVWNPGLPVRAAH